MTCALSSLTETVDAVARSLQTVASRVTSPPPDGSATVPGPSATRPAERTASVADAPPPSISYGPGAAPAGTVKFATSVPSASTVRFAVVVVPAASRPVSVTAPGVRPTATKRVAVPGSRTSSAAAAVGGVVEVNSRKTAVAP